MFGKLRNNFRRVNGTVEAIGTNEGIAEEKVDGTVERAVEETVGGKVVGKK